MIANDFVGGRQSANVMLFPDNLYRKIEGYVKNDHYLNFEESTFSILHLMGEVNSKIYLNNVEFINFTKGSETPLLVQSFGSVYLETILIENMTDINIELFLF